MLAPIAPESPISSQLGVDTMAAANAKLKVLPHLNKQKTLLNKFSEGLIMTVQKATSPTISVSTATIGLLIVMVGQFGAGIWWGASISKDSARQTDEIQNLKAENATLKVYIDNLREKQIKMEAIQENLVREQQVLTLMNQQKGNR